MTGTHRLQSDDMLFLLFMKTSDAFYDHIITFGGTGGENDILFIGFNCSSDVLYKLSDAGSASAHSSVEDVLCEPRRRLFPLPNHMRVSCYVDFRRYRS
jgi:hypothetical protein